MSDRGRGIPIFTIVNPGANAWANMADTCNGTNESCLNEYDDIPSGKYVRGSNYQIQRSWVEGTETDFASIPSIYTKVDNLFGP